MRAIPGTGAAIIGTVARGCTRHITVREIDTGRTAARFPLSQARRQRHATTRNHAPMAANDACGRAAQAVSQAPGSENRAFARP